MTLPTDIDALRRRAIWSVIIGGFFELFDFSIFGFFAGAIGRNFFPGHDPVVSTLSAFATFGVGFVMRPVGGLVIGAYSDRHGRKSALVFTLLLMAGATGATGLIPPYASIGVAAPVLLVLLRLLQGFSAGGEWGRLGGVPGGVRAAEKARVLRQLAAVRRRLRLARRVAVRVRDGVHAGPGEPR